MSENRKEDSSLLGEEEIRSIYQKLIADPNSEGRDHLPREDARAVGAKTSLSETLRKAYVTPTFESWLAWARTHKITEEVRAFLSNNQALLGLSGQGAESPRGWERASGGLRRIFSQVTSADSLETRDLGLLIKRYVYGIGPNASDELKKFLEKVEGAPGAADIAQEPKTTDVFNDNPEVAQLVVERMVSSAQRSPQRIPAFEEYTARMLPKYKESFQAGLLAAREDALGSGAAPVPPQPTKARAAKEAKPKQGRKA